MDTETLQVAKFGALVSVERPSTVNPGRLERKVFGGHVKFLEHPIREIELAAQYGWTLGRQGAGKIRDHCEGKESGDNSLIVDGFAF